ncbi:MAG: HAD-IB family hydrolase, partial [Pseudonocardiaceae bacterium]
MSRRLPVSRRRQQAKEQRAIARAALAGEASANAAIAGAALAAVIADAEIDPSIPPDLSAAAFFDVDNT